MNLDTLENIREYKTWVQIAISGGFVAKIWTNLFL
jgi:hypothetical protein